MLFSHDDFLIVCQPINVLWIYWLLVNILVAIVCDLARLYTSLSERIGFKKLRGYQRQSSAIVFLTQRSVASPELKTWEVVRVAVPI